MSAHTGQGMEELELALFLEAEVRGVGGLMGGRSLDDLITYFECTGFTFIYVLSILLNS